MIYVYDILLNFNKTLIEFFEWNDTDNIKYAKKITLFKINKKTMQDFLKNEIILCDDFIKSTVKYKCDGTNSKDSYALFTDGKIVIGVQIKNKKIEKLSRLIIDEEDEVLTIAENLKEININYRIIKEKEKEEFLLTRKEKSIKEKLKKEIDILYQKNNNDKLEYLYYEYTGKESKNKELIYSDLIKSLENINSKHELVLNILELSNKKTNK